MLPVLPFFILEVEEELFRDIDPVCPPAPAHRFRETAARISRFYSGMRNKILSGFFDEEVVLESKEALLKSRVFNYLFFESKINDLVKEALRPECADFGWCYLLQAYIICRLSFTLCIFPRENSMVLNLGNVSLDPRPVSEAEQRRVTLANWRQTDFDFRLNEFTKRGFAPMTLLHIAGEVDKAFGPDIEKVCQLPEDRMLLVNYDKGKAMVNIMVLQ